MIRTQLFENAGCVVNACTKLVSVKDIVEAAAETKKLAGEAYPVLWDFRYCELEESASHAQPVFSRIMVKHRRKISEARRAFVVSGDKQRKAVELIAGQMRAPWSWVIFEDLQEAVDWLGLQDQIELVIS